MQLEQEKGQLIAELAVMKQTGESQETELQQSLAAAKTQAATLENALQHARQNSSRLENLNETLRKQVDDVRQQMETNGRKAQQKLDQEMVKEIGRATCRERVSQYV